MAPEGIKSREKYVTRGSEESGHFDVIYERASDAMAVVLTAMRRELPDGPGSESLRVSSDMAALSAPSTRRGRHQQPERPIAFCTSPIVAQRHWERCERKIIP